MQKRGEKLREILAKRGMSIRELSRRAGIGQSTVQAMIENDFKDSSIDRVISIANALDIKVQDFVPEAASRPDITFKDSNGNIHMIDVKYKPSNTDIYENASRSIYMRDVNYLGEISAGDRTSVYCEESKESIELPKFLFGKYANRKDAFVMKVSGESMNKVIPNNSYVMCIPVSHYSELNDGDIVIYTYENESSMKRYYEKKDLIVFSPESDNKDFFDFVISKKTINDVKINAKVIAYHVILE